MKYSYEFEMMGVTTDIIVTRNNQSEILLIKRKDDPYKNTWALPGGYVEINETFMDAAYRELYEETHIKQIELTHVGHADAVERDPRGRTVSIIYKGELHNNQEIAQAGDDAKEVLWFSLETLPDLAFDHKEIIEKNIEK